MQTATKAYKGKGMEGWIARWYARTRQKDMQQFRDEAKRVAQHLAPGSRVLEVAPGPGFFAIELARLGDFTITGLDISQTFVEMAAANAHKAGVQINFQLGNASALPFGDESFEFIYCSAAFKNFSEPVRALDEMHRVLRPRGEALIVDLNKQVPLEEVHDYVKQSGRNGIDAWMTNLTFKHMLIKRAYTPEQFVAMAEESRFGACEVNLASMALEVRLRKDSSNPQ